MAGFFLFPCEKVLQNSGEKDKVRHRYGIVIITFLCYNPGNMILRRRYLQFMKIAKESIKYKLNPEGITASAAKMAEFLRTMQYDKQDITKACLTMEQALGSWQEQYGAEKKFYLYFGSKFGVPQIMLRVRGAKCNPFQDEEEEYGSWGAKLLADVDLEPYYSYEKGENTVVFKLRRPQLKPFVPLLLAIALAIGGGFVGNLLLGTATEHIAELVLEPIYELGLAVLTAAALPMIFLSMVYDICGVGDMATFSNVGRNMIFRFVITSYVLAAAAIVILFPLCGLHFSGNMLEPSHLSGAFQLILGIFPTNLIRPFVEGNSLQIICIAVVVGVALLGLGTRASGITNLVGELHDLLHHIMGGLAKMVPVLVFLLLLKLLWSDSLHVLTLAWRPLLYAVIVIYGLTAVVGLCVCAKERVSPRILIKKFRPAFVVAISTFSSGAAFRVCMENGEKHLGIDNGLLRFGLPLGINIYKIGIALNFVVVTLVMARYYAVEISIVWLLVALFMCVPLAIAAPPVPGGAMAGYTLLFHQLNIPEDALVVTMAIDIALDFISIAGTVLLVMLELILQAERQNALDKAVLRQDS